LHPINIRMLIVKWNDLRVDYRQAGSNGLGLD
jgi:hypothetical protein